MSLHRQFASNVISQGLARLLSIGANLLLLLVVAREMGADQFGQFSYVLAFAAIGVTFADLGTTAILSQGLVHHDGADRRRYLGNFLLMRAGLLLPVMLCATLAVLLLHGSQRGALLMAVVGLPVLSSRFFEPIYQVYGRPWLSLWSNLTFGLSQLVLAGLVWWHPDIGITPLMVGHVLSNFIYTATAMVLMWQLAPPDLRPQREMLSDILKLAAPIGVGAIFSTLMMRADVILLQHLRDTTDVGHYSAAYRLIDLAVFVAVTLVTPFITILSKDILEDKAAAVLRARQFTLAAGLFALPIALTVPVIAPQLVTLFWGPSFAPAADPLRVLMLNFVIVFLSLICYSINLAGKQVRYAFWASPLATLMCVGLDFWWIPVYGTLGAAWSSAIAQALVLLIALAFVFKDFGNLFEAHPWARLGLSCVALGLVQQAVAHWVGPWSAAWAGLLVYAALVWQFRLLPAGVVDALRKRRAA